MKKIILISLFFVASSFTLNAQDYRTGFGLRGGTSQGLSVKHFLSSETAIEGIVSTRWRGLMITGLYEIHNPAFDVYGLNWYYGGGAHVGFWNNSDYAIPWAETDYNGSYTILGVDAIIGIEYTFIDVPINISLDWKPAMNFLGYTGLWGDAGAVTVRYIIR
ncbi:MAG: hypothetical protein K8R41_05120 [Bacteroidales bacterium]|nr:hypothetical protein [Bacteroidales bacterium]